MPPAVLSVGDVYEVCIKARLNGNAHVNVWHFKCVQGHSTIETQLLAALLACYHALIPKLSTGFVLDNVTYQKINDEVGPLWEYNIPNTIATQGTATGEGLVSFASACLSIPTLMPGKGSKARKYIGGIPETAAVVDSFNPTDPYFIAILAFVACVIDKFIFAVDPVPGGKFWQLGIASRKRGATIVNGKPRKPYTGNFFFAATGMVAKKEIKSMVSRKAGKGA